MRKLRSRCIRCSILVCRNIVYFMGVQFSSVAQSCPTLYDPMGCSTPGLSVHHQLPELAQTHVHCIGDTVQPSHPLSSPSLPALNLSQHQGLFQGVSSSHQEAKVLEFQHEPCYPRVTLRSPFCSPGWTGVGTQVSLFLDTPP